MSYMDNPSPRRRHRTQITRQTCPGLGQEAANHGGQAPCGSQNAHDQHPMATARSLTPGGDGNA